MKKIFLIFILLGSSLMAGEFLSENISRKDSLLSSGATLEGQVEQELLKYGINDFRPFFYDVNQRLKNDLKENINTILDQNLFLINVYLPLNNFLLHDSTHVTITELEGGGVKWKYSPEGQKQREAFWELEQTPTSLTNYFVYNDANVVLYLAFKPIVEVIIDSSIDATSHRSIRALVVDVLNSNASTETFAGDFSLCEECVSLESGDIKILKKSLIEQELQKLAVIEYDLERGFVVHNEAFAQYLEGVQKLQDKAIKSVGLTVADLLDDKYFIEMSLSSVKYLNCDGCDSFTDDIEKNMKITQEIMSGYEKYTDLGLIPFWGSTKEESLGLTGIAKVFFTVYVDGAKQKMPPQPTKNFVEVILHGMMPGLENCDDCVSFEFIDDMYALKTEMMNKKLKDKIVIEYDIDKGFTFYDSTYIDNEESLLLDHTVSYEERLLFELNNTSKRCEDNINGLLDDTYFVEASVVNAKYILIQDAKKINQLQGTGKYEEADKILKKGRKELEKWEDVAYVRPSFSGDFFIIANFFLKINVNKNDPFMKEIINSSRQKKKSFDKIKSLIYSQYKELENCDDCVVFELADFNDLKANQLAKKEQINRSDVYANSWAVIIGINDYTKAPPLHYAVKDAENIQTMLVENFNFPKENIDLLRNEEATLAGIKYALNEIANKAGEQDRIVVFYSGHGQTISVGDGSDLGYLIPYDGSLSSPYATGIAMEEVHKMGRFSKAKHMLFLMDACYSGLMAENRKGINPSKEEGYLSVVANKNARQIITAGQKDQQVIEREEWQNSAFTKNLLSALSDWKADVDRDGYITAEELGLYLKRTVTEDSDKQQTPVHSRFIKSGDGEFIFFRN